MSFHAPGMSGDANQAALEQAEMLLGRWQEWSIEMGRPPTTSAAEWRAEMIRKPRYSRETLVDVLVHHWPTRNNGCECGGVALGESFPEHVADVFEKATTYKCEECGHPWLYGQEQCRRCGNRTRA